MRGRRYTTALACALVGIALGAVAAEAATSTHLTAAAWRALDHINGDTPAQCQTLGRGSSDQEVQGIVGVCIDDADFSAWINRMQGNCSGATPASECLQDAEGVVADLKAEIAWANWFTARLASGGCHSFFSTLSHSMSELLPLETPLVNDLREHRSQQFQTDYSNAFGGALAIGFSLATPATNSDRLACNPA